MQSPGVNSSQWLCLRFCCRFCVCGGERGHRGAEENERDSTFNVTSGIELLRLLMLGRPPLAR